MGLNFTVDLLLILAANRLSGFPPDIKGAIPAALLGAVYSGGCLMPGFRFLGSTLWRLICLTLMGLLAFGWNCAALRRTVVFILLSMALGGMATGLGGGNFGTLVLSAICVWLLCSVGFRGNPGQVYVPISIPHGNGRMNLMALRDTGNTLRDPVTGESVVVISAEAAAELTGFSEEQLRHPVETAARHPGYRLIPYHAVGQPGGMLLMKRYADATVGKQKKSLLVAFSSDKIGQTDGYQALAGGMV